MDVTLATFLPHEPKFLSEKNKEDRCLPSQRDKQTAVVSFKSERTSCLLSCPPFTSLLLMSSEGEGGWGASSFCRKQQVEHTRVYELPTNHFKDELFNHVAQPFFLFFRCLPCIHSGNNLPLSQELRYSAFKVLFLIRKG